MTYRHNTINVPHPLTVATSYFEWLGRWVTLELRERVDADINVVLAQACLEQGRDWSPLERVELKHWREVKLSALEALLQLCPAPTTAGVTVREGARVALDYLRARYPYRVGIPGLRA